VKLNFIKDKEILFIVRLGLTLRKLEVDKERLQNLRDKIFKKYKIKGLHIAEFVQNGILNRYVGILMDELISIENLEKEIEDILKNIEKHTIFVQVTTKKLDIIKNANTIVEAHSPSIFIISGIKAAAKIVRNSADQLKIVLNNYEFESFSSEEKENLFFKRKKPA